MSYELKTIGQESLYESVSFSPSDLLEPKRSKMTILHFSPCPGFFSGLGGWFLFQMASFGPLQSARGWASSNFDFTNLSIHAICKVWILKWSVRRQMSQRQNVPLHYASPWRHNVPTYAPSPATFCPTFSIWIPLPRAMLAGISGISWIYLWQLPFSMAANISNCLSFIFL